MHPRSPPPPPPAPPPPPPAPPHAPVRIPTFHSLLLLLLPALPIPINLSRPSTTTTTVTHKTLSQGSHKEGVLLAGRHFKGCSPAPGAFLLVAPLAVPPVVLFTARRVRSE